MNCVVYLILNPNQTSLIRSVVDQPFIVGASTVYGQLYLVSPTMNNLGSQSPRSMITYALPTVQTSTSSALGTQLLVRRICRIMR